MANRPKKWVAVYTRISTDFPREDGQAKALGQYVAGHGFKTVRWYRDKVSGKDVERPAMARLRSDILAGKVSAVLCWKLDRLSRSLRDGMDLLADWTERGIRVVSVAQELDLNATVGKTIACLLRYLVEMERENKNERIRAGIAARKAQGRPIGRPKGLKVKWSKAKRRVDVELAKSLRRQGARVPNIAARFGVSRQAVYQALKE